MPGIYNSYLLHYYSRYMIFFNLNYLLFIYRLDDRFPALCLFIKHWAKQSGIADASQGFLNRFFLL